MQRDPGDARFQRVRMRTSVPIDERCRTQHQVLQSSGPTSLEVSPRFLCRRRSPHQMSPTDTLPHPRFRRRRASRMDRANRSTPAEAKSWKFPRGDCGSQADSFLVETLTSRLGRSELCGGWCCCRRRPFSERKSANPNQPGPLQVRWLPQPRHRAQSPPHASVGVMVGRDRRVNPWRRLLGPSSKHHRQERVFFGWSPPFKSVFDRICLG